MRALLDILEDERRIVCSIQTLVDTANFTSDQRFINRLAGEKADYENRLEEIRDEIKEYFEMLDIK